MIKMDVLSLFKSSYRKLKKLISTAHTDSRKIYDPDFPSSYHFLMTNYCNAQCVFCNQSFTSLPKKEITLEKIKIMIANIPTDSARIFHFSGGGEPFLCPDLFEIIKYVNIKRPSIAVSIRTNGLLIEKYAKKVADLNISRLEISIHGTGEENDHILQRKGAADTVFKGIFLLNDRLKSLNKKMVKVFCPAVSKINIASLPRLIGKASELAVNEVIVEFCRYYPHRVTGKLVAEDSLYFHKKLYNTTIQESKLLAARLGIRFEYDALFGQGAHEFSCCMPWSVMLIDPDGDVFPCCGGEERFGEKVKSGRYCFGNILLKPVSEFWNSPEYINIRKTCVSKRSDPLTPECENCHRTIKNTGPDNKGGHIINKSQDITCP
jgi:MoaA/NifB/PqqE/SkfB family radical SAM enzyme